MLLSRECLAIFHTWMFKENITGQSQGQHFCSLLFLFLSVFLAFAHRVSPHDNTHPDVDELPHYSVWRSYTHTASETVALIMFAAD